MVDAIALSVEIPEDRHLVIDLPMDVPAGAAKIIIQPQEVEVVTDGKPVNTAREIARAKLLAAGALVTDYHAPPDTVPLSNEELEQLGQMPPGARSSESIIDEERGLY